MILLLFVLFLDDDVTSVAPLWLPQLSVMMEDLWGVVVGVFQLWMFVVVFLIMLPAMFGLSLGVTGVYIQILVKILEVLVHVVASVTVFESHFRTRLLFIEYVCLKS